MAVVAPFTGAWIETRHSTYIITTGPVAPFTGAWIETCRRGTRVQSRRVAPFTGAWIETTSSVEMASGFPHNPANKNPHPAEVYSSFFDVMRYDSPVRENIFE